MKGLESELSNIWDRTFCENSFTIFGKHHIVDFWQGSQYSSGKCLWKNAYWRIFRFLAYTFNNVQGVTFYLLNILSSPIYSHLHFNERMKKNTPSPHWKRECTCNSTKSVLHGMLFRAIKVIVFVWNCRIVVAVLKVLRHLQYVYPIIKKKSSWSYIVNCQEFVCA